MADRVIPNGAMPPARTAALTAAALVAFAANSLLCRLALRGGEIDAASYTGVRLGAGALVLGALAWPRAAARPWQGGSWGSALALFGYAAPFSFAYLRIGAGVGALVLFGCVQATMLAVGIARGERPRRLVWLGLALAIGGLVTLTRPGTAAPDALGAALMAVAGVAWGAYSLRGKTSVGDPLVATAGNFARTVPMAAALTAIALGGDGGAATARGLGLAAASGALASGLGYATWYAALRGLTATRAAALQLLVPLLAAGGAVLLLDEPITRRLALAALAITGGVALAIRGRS